MFTQLFSPGIIQALQESMGGLVVPHKTEMPVNYAGQSMAHKDAKFVGGGYEAQKFNFTKEDLEKYVTALQVPPADSPPVAELLADQLPPSPLAHHINKMVEYTQNYVIQTGRISSRQSNVEKENQILRSIVATVLLSPPTTAIRDGKFTVTLDTVHDVNKHFPLTVHQSLADITISLE